MQVCRLDKIDYEQKNGAQECGKSSLAIESARRPRKKIYDTGVRETEIVEFIIIKMNYNAGTHQKQIKQTSLLYTLISYQIIIFRYEPLRLYRHKYKYK